MDTLTDFNYTVAVVEEFDALLINSGSDEEQASLGKYPAKLHARKVAAELLSEHGIQSGLIFLPGEPSRVFEDSDQGPAFRQRRYFYYLTGANFPDCAVTYDIKKESLVLWIPYVEPRQVLWYGSTPGPSECLERFDVDEVCYVERMEDYISDRLRYGSSNTCYILHKDQKPNVDLDSRAVIRFDAGKLLPCMDAARVVKTDYEVAMIRKANEVSSAAHRKVAEKLKGFKNEREIEALFQAECTVKGAKKQAYPIIAGSGTNASTLHYDENDQDLMGKQLVVLDAGCEWDCYASDITRTLPISGTLTKEAREIHAIVEKMQKECIEAIKPGVLYYKLHLHACAVALVGLMKLGILRSGSVGEIWNSSTVAAFFPHGLGHHVGLETHDVTGREKLLLEASAQREELGRRPPKRGFVTPEILGELRPSMIPPPYKGRQKLEKNMIVTVEPGIYFCREYIEGYFLNSPTHSRFINKDVLEKYYPVGGIRIEDDILVTDTGYENLTSAPKGEELFKVINGE